mgnify:CR=1 FL=1
MRVSLLAQSQWLVWQVDARLRSSAEPGPGVPTPLISPTTNANVVLYYTYFVKIGRMLMGGCRKSNVQDQEKITKLEKLSSLAASPASHSTGVWYIISFILIF